MKSRRRRESFYNPLQCLEGRVLLSGVTGATVLFTPGSAQSQPTEWGTIPSSVHGDFASFFSPTMSLTKDIYGNAIDFNKDSRTDLVLGGNTSGVVGYYPNEQLVPTDRDGLGEAYLSSPDGGFTVIPGIQTIGNLKNYSWSQIAVLDLNGDGYQDILSVRSDSTVDLKLYDSVSNHFTTVSNVSTLNYSGYGGNSNVSMADVNGDGFPDLALPNYDVNHQLTGFSIFTALAPPLGTPWGGQFAPDAYATVTIREPIPLLNQSMPGRGPANVQPLFADFSGDGKPDMVIPEQQGVTIFANPGDGKFIQANSVFVNSVDSVLGFNLQVADFNNDSRMDLISTPNQASGNMETITPPNIRYWNGVYAPVSVYLNTTPSGGPVSFSVSGAGPTDQYNGYLQVGDFNLDGNSDIAMSFASQVGTSFAVATGDGQGGFSTFSRYSAYVNNDGVTTEFLREVVSIGVGDFNADGQLDIAATSNTIGSTSKGNSQFAVGITGISYNRTFDAPGVSPTTLPAGTVAQPYSQQLLFTGGDNSMPYVVTVSPNGNPLPDGLTLSSTGLISGTPTQRGPFQITFHVTQANGLFGDAPVNLTINPVSSPTVTISPGTLPDGAVNTPYSQQLTTAGASGAVTFSVTSGLLPNGLKLSPTGLISGTPTMAGTYGFTVYGVDPNGAYGSRTYSVNVGQLSLSGLPASAYYVQGTPSLAFASNLVVTQTSGQNLLGATVSFVNWQAGDRFSFYNSYALQHTFTEDLVAHTATLTITGSETAAHYQTTLRSVRFYNVAGNPNSAVTRVATIEIHDQYSSTSASENLNVAKYLAGLSSNLNYIQGSPPLYIAQNLVVTAPVGVKTISSATVSFTNWQGEDRLAFYNSIALQHTFTQDLVAHTATLTITGKATPSEYQTLLRSVTYRDVAGQPNTSVIRNATFTVNDGTNTVSASEKITVIPVNQPPLVQVNNPAPVTYHINASPIAIMSQALVSDPDSENLTKLTVQITSGYQIGHDILSFANQLGITGSFNAGTGTLTLSGLSYVGNYRQALRSVMFNTIGSGVSTATRIFTVIATDETNVSSIPVSRNMTLIP